MDRVEQLAGVATLARLGDLADDVVLACSSARRLGRVEEAVALQAGLSLVQSLAEFEQPNASTPASLNAMSQVEAVSEAVDRVTLTIHGSPDRYFNELVQDLEAILQGDFADSRMSRVEGFFSTLAMGSLQTTEAIMTPGNRDTAWTTTALSF